MRRKSEEVNVTVNFKSGSVYFKAPFWWTEHACIRHAKEALGPVLSQFASDFKVVKEYNDDYSFYS